MRCHGEANLRFVHSSKILNLFSGKGAAILGTVDGLDGLDDLEAPGDTMGALVTSSVIEFYGIHFRKR